MKLENVIEFKQNIDLNLKIAISQYYEPISCFSLCFQVEYIDF